MKDESRADGSEAPKTIDNVSCRLGDDIAANLGPGAKVYVASAGFSLSAFEALADQLESVESVRFVFTAPAFLPENAVKERLGKERREFFIPGVGEASVLGTDYEIRLRNRLMQKAVAKRCADWICKGNVAFASVAETKASAGWTNATTGSKRSAPSSPKRSASSPAKTISTANTPLPRKRNESERKSGNA